MLDIRFVRKNPELVKENMEKKFQHEKIQLVDDVLALDIERRTAQQEMDNLRADRNRLSKQIGGLMKQGKRDEAEGIKQEVTKNSARLAELKELEGGLADQVTKIMMRIPNMIDTSVPIGKDDSENIEVERYGDTIVPAFDVPYHTDIM